MVTARVLPPHLLAVALLLASACLAMAAPAADDEALRRKALGLNNVTGSDAIKGQVAALLDDAAGSKQLLTVAAGLAKDKEQPFNVNALQILSTVAHQLRAYDNAEVFYRAYVTEAVKLQSGQKISQAFSGFIDMLYETKKFAESEKLCREFLELDVDENVNRIKPAVLRRMIQAMTRQGKTDVALKLVDNLQKAQPTNPLTLELKGWVHREAGNYEDAAKAYEELLDRLAKDKNLPEKEKEEFAADVRYLLSGVYVDLKNIDKATEHLKTLLAREPDSASYNNDLGYIWADNDRNLEEAERMIRKALELDRKQRQKANPNLKPESDRDNAAYLDSLGWVLYKQKKFKEAREPLLKAVQQPDGQHVEILDHLGDVHMALGEKAEAITVWKKALEVTASSKREQERKAQVEKKLKALEKE